MIATIAVAVVPFAALALIGKISNISIHEVFTGLGLSFMRLTIAYGISLITAVAIAITIGQGKIAQVCMPILDLLQNIPSFALIPVFVSLFGYTNEMVIVFAATCILWPILFSMIAALHTTRTDITQAAQLFGAKGIKRITHYLLPASFPALVSGSMIGMGLGWETIIGVEIIGMHNGIGVFLNSSETQSEKTLLTFGLLALLIVVFSLNRLVWMPLLRRAQRYGD